MFANNLHSILIIDSQTIAKEWWLILQFYIVVTVQMLAILINHVREITDCSASIPF